MPFEKWDYKMMNLSIVLSTQPAAFNALAYKGKLAENLAKISQLGYDGVELAVRDPHLLDIEELEILLRENNLPVPAIGTGQAYGEEGLSFIHPEKKIREQAIERIKAQLKLAKKLNALVIIGLVRGRISQLIPRELAEWWLIDALTACAVSEPSVKIAIEPINRYETDIINTVDSALKFLGKLKKDNVGLLLDTFHMNIEEPSINESIRIAQDKIFHIHIADSNRWFPGAGHLDFRNIFETLGKINYTGFISAEIMPLPDADTAAENTIMNVKRFWGLCV